VTEPKYKQKWNAKSKAQAKVECQRQSASKSGVTEPKCKQKWNARSKVQAKVECQKQSQSPSPSDHKRNVKTSASKIGTPKAKCNQ